MTKIPPSRALAPQLPSDAIVSRQGELVAVKDATTDELAAWLDRVKDARSALQASTGAVHRELVARMDKEAKWTARIGGFKVSAPSPDAGKVEYDGAALAAALRGLVKRKVITKGAMDAAVERVVSYKPIRNGINRLLKLAPEVVEAVESAEVEPDARERRASVSIIP